MNDSTSVFKTVPQPDQFVGEAENYDYNNRVKIPGLEKFSAYQFFLIPFFDTFRGRPSNSIVAQTLEDGQYTLISFIFFLACVWLLTL
jgi:hypothetical protein